MRRNTGPIRFLIGYTELNQANDAINRHKTRPYEILAPIGAGGMGEVWKARNTRLDRIVAIKTSSEEFQRTI
jgi:serine/threonine protein kinase